MSEIFDTNYDKSIYGTRDDMAKLVGVSAATMTKVIKDSKISSIGVVRTGKIGKPAELFKLVDLELAYKIHQAKIEVKKNASKAARALKDGILPSNDNSEDNSDEKTFRLG